MLLSASVFASSRHVKQRQRFSEIAAKRRNSAKSENRRKKKTTIGSLKRSSRGTRIDAFWLLRKAMRPPRLRGIRRGISSRRFS
jgi:hypothetical protein